MKTVAQFRQQAAFLRDSSGSTNIEKTLLKASLEGGVATLEGRAASPAVTALASSQPPDFKRLRRQSVATFERQLC